MLKSMPSRLLRSLTVPCLGLARTAPGEIKVPARKNPGKLKYAWAFAVEFKGPLDVVSVAETDLDLTAKGA